MCDIMYGGNITSRIENYGLWAQKTMWAVLIKYGTTGTRGTCVIFWSFETKKMLSNQLDGSLETPPPPLYGPILKY